MLTGLFFVKISVLILYAQCLELILILEFACLDEISLKNNLLQVPVNFKYYVPVKSNYCIYFLFGTDLDIYTNQKLNYSEKSDTMIMLPRESNFTAKGKVSVVNNLVISAGIEKNWKSWYFHLQPYVSPKISEVFYRPKEVEFGVRFGIGYSFGL